MAAITGLNSRIRVGPIGASPASGSYGSCGGDEPVAAPCRHAFQVGTGTERAARAPQHRNLRGRHLFRRRETHRPVHRQSACRRRCAPRPVDDDGGHRILAFDAHGSAVAHDFLLRTSMSSSCRRHGRARCLALRRNLTKPAPFQTPYSEGRSRDPSLDSFKCRRTLKVGQQDLCLFQPRGGGEERSQGHLEASLFDEGAAGKPAALRGRQDGHHGRHPGGGRLARRHAPPTARSPSAPRAC